MRTLMIGIVLVFLIVSGARAQPRVLDSFEDIGAWSVVASDGVTLTLSQDAGTTGKALRLDFDFAKGSGFCIARRSFTPPVEVPANYRFDVQLRGEGPANNFEFKMIDPTGDNVWWVNTRAFEFPREWTRRTIRARHVSFAWGPSSGKTPLGAMAHLEIAIAASSGGRGTVWLDELTFEPLEEARLYQGVPTVRASSEAEAGKAAATIKGDGGGGTVEFRSDPSDPAPWIELDFGQEREFGGVVIDWDAEDFGVEYEVTAIDAAGGARPVTRVVGSNGGRDYVFAPESAARRLRVAVGKASRSRGAGVERIEVMPLTFGESPNEMYKRIAADSPRGWYPKYFLGEQSYWTVVGLPGDDHEALINEEGAIEVGRRFSLEPFVFADGSLRSWSDWQPTASLDADGAPFPVVAGESDGLGIETRVFAVGRADASSAFVSYRVSNAGEARRSGSLYVAIRPFQVNPPWQFLNTPGGVGRVGSVRASPTAVTIDDRPALALHTPPKSFGAATFGSGDVVEHLATGRLPAPAEATDPLRLASAALAYPFDLGPGESVEVSLEAILGGDGAGPVGAASRDDAASSSELERRRRDAQAEWESRLNRVALRLPTDDGRRIADTLRTVLAHILINADGPGIQPGSRAYERTWIRDGCLTSSALLALGHAPEVRAFLDWFAPFQYESGKIPCCVDRRGPDPVPEHDSHGQYIYAVLNYHRYANDAAFLRLHWPHVQGAVKYMEVLRAERMTPEFQSGDKRVFYGLMPESISHEGYSAKAMHSYWDDFFALKGLQDAATIAGLLGETEEATRITALAADFQRTLRESIALAMRQRNIEYIPGCAELGDFDATSTTIGVWPGGELGTGGPLDGALAATFEKYWEFFRERRDGRVEWEAYTPYETRAIGTFVRLGQRERAMELTRWFMAHLRPQGWNQWAEVVWNDAAAPKFIGDMPHTWVGSDFVNSVRAMLWHEREAADGTEQVVLMAGLPEAWVRSPEGIDVGDSGGTGGEPEGSGWPTPYGPIRYAATTLSERTTIRIAPGAGGFRIPDGGLVVSPPSPEKIASITVDGTTVEPGNGEVVLRRVPAEVILTWRPETGSPSPEAGTR